MFSMNKIRCRLSALRASVWLVLVVSLVVLPCAHADQKKTEYEELRINLDLQEIPLNSVAQEIRKQTGYTVILSESLVTLPVTGQYKDVAVDKFFTRVLKGKNISILSDESEKIIVVKAFGDKIIALQGSVELEKLSKLVPNMDITYEELQEREKLNREELEAALNDPNTIDPFTGKTLGEILEQEEKNKLAMEKALNNDETVVPQTGDMTMAEVREREKRNREELEEKLNNPETVDPVTSMKLSDLKSREELNKRELEAALSNPDTVDPFTGLTIRELREMENNAE